MLGLDLHPRLHFVRKLRMLTWIPLFYRPQHAKGKIQSVRGWVAIKISQMWSVGLNLLSSGAVTRVRADVCIHVSRSPGATLYHSPTPIVPESALPSSTITIFYGGTSPRPMPHDLAASRASFGAHVRWIHRLSRHYRANLELAGCF